VQVILVGTTVVGLISLILTGLFDGANPPIPAQDSFPPWGHAASVSAACLLVFVGFDLAVYEKKNDPYAVKAMIIAIVVTGLIYVAWGWVSAKYVPLEKLVDTSIPHMRTARALLGSAGRIWMGIIVMAGVSAAVNALFMAVPRMTAALAEEGLLPSFLAMGQKRKIVGVLMFGAAVAAMMASGMAGEPILETFMKAGIFFWFLHYAVTIGAAIKVHRRTPVETIGQHVHGSVALLFVSFMVMLLAMSGVFVLAEDRLILFYKIAMIFGIALILGVLCVSLKKHGKEVTP
jgi:APA family basic amino acid/polyamine antiporter